MRELKEIPDDPMKLEAIVLEKQRTGKEEELRNAVLKFKELIKEEAAAGVECIDIYDDKVQDMLREYKFINWNMVGKVFSDAGYMVNGERNQISWVRPEHMRGEE